MRLTLLLARRRFCHRPTSSVISAIEGLKQEGKPNVIIANTTKGAGISFIQGRPEWHHRVPKGEEIALALEELKDE